MKRKGILLAGGTGSRMGKLVASCSKQLLPVADIPLVLYPLAILRELDLADILIICRPEEAEQMNKICDASCISQQKPEGIAQALLLAQDWLDGHPSVLLLGDNLFHGPGLMNQFKLANCATNDGATVFATQVENPQDYGVVEVDVDGKAIALNEKPSNPKSNLVIPGIYFYDEKAPRLAGELTPSERGELEITDLNSEYLKRGELQVVMMDESSTWIDVGTPQSLDRADSFVRELGSSPPAING